jgi:hypothetical protein
MRWFSSLRAPGFAIWAETGSALCVGDIEHDEFAWGVDGLPDWESDGPPGQGTFQSA